MFEVAELTAKCDNGFTIWQRTSGLMLSHYRFEIRDGTDIIEANLRSNKLRDVLNERSYHCLFLGGG